jgi:hypothetical protein
MYNLYSYARKRLFVESFQRDQFLKVLVKRTLKSISRSTGGRIHTNKWMKLLDSLVSTQTDAIGTKLLDSFKAEVSKYERTHQQTCLRINFLIMYIRTKRITGENIASLFDDYLPEFNAAEMGVWLMDCATQNGLLMSDCGHFERNGHRVVMHGGEHDYSLRNTACTKCANESIANGTRVVGVNNWYILSAYAVRVLNLYQDTEIHDRRNPNIAFDMRRSVWHVQGWSPYTNIIDSYHSSKNKGFKVIESPWLASNRRAFGVELEVQVRSGDKNAAAGRVHEVLNPSGDTGEYCYFERDGSIGEGFEIVTQPAGLDVHRQKFALFLQDAELKRGLRSHEGGSCGLHVHVGREYVTQSQIYRIQSFLNDVRNEALIRSIARRYENGYCKFKPHMAKFTAHNKQNGDRYEALNVTNHDTIEFRIFRGSLRYESVMAALEFCNAILTFCTPGVTSLVDFTAVGFKKFIIRPDNRTDTKFLRSYLSLDANNDNERQAA